MNIMSKSVRLVGQTAQAGYRDPAAWVAFTGFVLGGIQTLIGATGTALFSGKQMGVITLVLGIVGLVVRGVETFFLKRAQNAFDDAPTHDDGTASDQDDAR